MSTKIDKLRKYLRLRREIEEKQPDEFELVTNFKFSNSNVLRLLDYIGNEASSAELLGDIAHEHGVHLQIINHLLIDKSIEKSPEILASSLWILSNIGYSAEMNLSFKFLNKLGTWFTHFKDFNVKEACLWVLLNSMNPFTAKWIREFGIEQTIIHCFPVFTNKLCEIGYGIMINLHSMNPVPNFTKWNVRCLHLCTTDRLITPKLEILYREMLHYIANECNESKLDVDDPMQVLDDSIMILAYLTSPLALQSCLLLIGNIITFENNITLDIQLWNRMLYALNTAKSSTTVLRLVFWITNNLQADGFKIADDALKAKLCSISNSKTTDLALFHELQIFRSHL